MTNDTEVEDGASKSCDEEVLRHELPILYTNELNGGNYPDGKNKPALHVFHETRPPGRPDLNMPQSPTFGRKLQDDPNVSQSPRIPPDGPRSYGQWKSRNNRLFRNPPTDMVSDLGKRLESGAAGEVAADEEIVRHWGYDESTFPGNAILAFSSPYQHRLEPPQELVRPQTRSFGHEDACRMDPPSPVLYPNYRHKNSPGIDASPAGMRQPLAVPRYNNSCMKDPRPPELIRDYDNPLPSGLNPTTQRQNGQHQEVREHHESTCGMGPSPSGICQPAAVPSYDNSCRKGPQPPALIRSYNSPPPGSHHVVFRNGIFENSQRKCGSQRGIYHSNLCGMEPQFLAEPKCGFENSQPTGSWQPASSGHQNSGPQFRSCQAAANPKCGCPNLCGPYRPVSASNVDVEYSNRTEPPPATYGQHFNYDANGASQSRRYGGHGCCTPSQHSNSKGGTPQRPPGTDRHPRPLTKGTNNKDPSLKKLYRIVWLQNEQLALLQRQVDRLTERLNGGGIGGTPEKGTRVATATVGVMTSFVNLNWSEPVREVSSSDTESSGDETRAEKSSNERQTLGADPEDSLTLHGLQIPTLPEPAMSPQASLHLDINEYRVDSSSSSEQDEDEQTSESEDEGNLPPVGWTFYDSVVGQVNNMLTKSDDVGVGQTDGLGGCGDVRNATFDQLRCLGVSFIADADNQTQKRVTFDRAFYPKVGPQPRPTQHADSDTSMRINALAMKYLTTGGHAPNAGVGDRMQGVALCNVAAAAANAGNSNLSYATLRYLERYQLTPQAPPLSKHDEPPPRRPKEFQREDRQAAEMSRPKTKKKSRSSEKRNEAPPHHYHHHQQSAVAPSSKILDITAIKRQPKLLPKKLTGK